MVRNVIGGILALAGAAAAVLGVFLPWYGGRDGVDYRVSSLFDGITDSSTGVWGSIFLPFAFAALLTLLGLGLRSRALIAVAGAVVVGFTVLWMVRQGQAANGLAIATDGTGLGTGVAYTLGGGIALLLASVVMVGRRRPARPQDPPPEVYEEGGPYGWYGDGQGDPPGPYRQ